MSHEIIKKLRLAGCSRALILNGPIEYPDKLAPLPEGVRLDNQIEEEQAYDFVQCFVYNSADVKELAPKAIRAVTPEGLLWICYPKGSGKIKTDINRDSGWQPVTDLQYEGVTLISIDDTWSAMRFRPANQVKSSRSGRTAPRTDRTSQSSATADKTVIIPDDLAEAFKSRPEAAAFYETLAYTHRKEYVRWITDAKREETRKGRIEKTVDKLARGIKNPTIKE